jgi:nitronate monooxygenase
MPLPSGFEDRLRLPAIAAPMFLASGLDLVTEVCRSGLVGTFPALNARSTADLAHWIDEILDRLARVSNPSPFGINLIVHKSNPRLQADLEIVVRRKVPLVITSLGAVKDIVDAVHGYGGLVFHDVISRRHAEKAAEAGVDGIIAVCAGAGGHGGTLSPFALVAEIRQVFKGTIVLGGSISTGAHVAAARVLGADMSYLGTRFIATREATVSEAQKQMILDCRASDVIYTARISGVGANFLRPSVTAAGLDAEEMNGTGDLDFEHEAKAWKHIWSAGQGVGSIHDVPPAAELCERLIAEYRAAVASFA